jgi:hypothetical protein
MAVPDEREVKVVPECFLCSILTEAALEEQSPERRRYLHVAQSRNMERGKTSDGLPERDGTRGAE